MEEMIPPANGFSVGGGDFRAVGLGMLEEIKQACGLRPDHQVLDVGCGSGRLAIPLTQFLSGPGAGGGGYDGFDTVAEAIRHCQTRITPSYPNFRFVVADVYNRRYNRRGAFRDHEYVFPYPDRSFDVVIATSIFTHLLSAGAEHYVSECARVLKPGGRLFATWFLLTPQSEAALAAREGTIRFPWRYPGYAVYRRGNPEAAVAYEEPVVRAWYKTFALALTESPSYGLWCGRPSPGYGGYQDRLVATREQA